MNTQRTIKILALGILTALSAGIASAQTGSLQGRQLFLYDGGTAANLNRITLQTPADATLVANWALTFPATAGTVNQLMVNTGSGVLDWTSNLTLVDLTLTGNLGVGGNTTLGDLPTDVVTINGTVNFPNLAPGLPLQTNLSGEVVSELINLTAAADITGILPVTNGGTGLNAVGLGDIIYGSAANTYSTLPIGVAGEYLGVTGGLPDWKPIASDMWVLGGNTSGITGVNNILGINMVSAAPLRMYSNGFERMRLTSGGDVRIENLDGVGATQLNIIGTATQAGANLLNVQNSALNFAFRVDEQPGTLARIQVGDGTLDGRIRLFNGVPGGVANIEIQNNLAVARNYTIPTVEGDGRFVVANGAGTAGQILQTNGNNLRATWTSTPTLTDLILTGNLQVDGNTILGSNGVDVVTINGATSFPNLTPGLPLQTNGAGLVVSELINLAGATDITGVLPVANGGTGIANIPANSIVYGNGTGPVTPITPGNNQILISSGAGVPTWSSSLPTATTIPFNQISTGTNSTAAMTVNNGASVLLGTAGAIIQSNQFITSTSISSAVDLATTEVNGILPIANGGTGASTAVTALSNLGGQPLDADLTAISALVTTGNLVRTGAGTYATRTIIGSSPIAVADGDGVAGNPTISLTGIVPVANGGTGLSTAPVNSILYASAANTYSSLTPGNNQILISGPAGVPVWSSSLPIATTVPFNQISTGANSTAAMTVNNGASIVLGTAGAIIEANRFIGSGSTTNAVDLATAEVNGVLPIANGGTGLSTTPLSNQILVGNGAGYSLTNLSTIAWIPGGNTGITGANNILGITDVNANPLRIFTNNVQRMTIASDGLVGIGTAPVATYQLALAGNQRFTAVGTSTISAAGTELRLEQTTDVFGFSRLRLQHRNGSNGALFETDPAGPALVDFGFKPGTGVQSNIRLETRGASLRNIANTANGEFQFLMASTTSPLYVFSIGRAAAAFENVDVGIGDATPNSRFTVGNASEFRVSATGDLIRIKNVPYVWPAANATGVLTNDAAGNLSWSPVSATSLTGVLPIANGGTGSSTAGGALTNLGAQPVDAELTAISGLAGTGFAVQTGAGTYAQRTIVGVSPISVADGNGVAGNPTISLTGIVPVANGGTGQDFSAATTGSIMYASAPGVFSTLSVGAAGQILTVSGGIPSWAAPASSSFSAITTGVNAGQTLEVGLGSSLAPISTGTITANVLSGLAGNGMVARTAAGTFTNRTIVGVSPISVANGSGVAGDPTISLTGIVPVANGGTGQDFSAVPIGSIMYANAVGGFTTLPAASNGDVLTLTAGVPSWVPTAGSSFSAITTGTNATATMTVNNGASILLGTAGAIIQSNEFITSTSVSSAVDLATTEVNGILPIANGGTGSSTAGGALTNLGAQPVDAELTAISGLAGTGFAVQTGAGTYAQRTIVGVSPISVANGSGVAGNPTISLTGIVPVANGGTGQDFSAVPIGSIMYANAVGGFTTLPAASNGDVLTLTAGVPSWVPTAGSSFSAITTGTNATATMTVNNGASILLGSAGAIIEANRFIGSGSTTNAVDLATAEVNGILPIANGGTGSSTAGGALTNLGAQPVDADLTSIAGVATTGILVRTGVDTYNTRLIAGTANEITVTNGDGVGGNPTISIPTAVTFTGKTVTGGTFTGSTLSGVTTKTGTMVNTANTAAAVAPTALGAPLAAFVNTWEKVEISNNGTGGTAYVSLPAGTDGQVMYARFRYSWTAGANAVIVRQPDNATATAIAFGGGAVGTIVAHMVYSGDESRWVILSAINNP
ncbi:MAG: hypothetical protein IPF79_14815 [Ignavibacteria bacterium]|nr:hypothetical protein [Ignavibacteria bacterium]